MLLHEILSQPTAPFREGHVISVLTRVLAKGAVPHFMDPAGNIVVGVSSRKDYLALLARKTREPVRLFIAHMDHPGFHGEEWLADGTLQIRWHGGSPTQHLEGAKVWLSDRKEWRAEGKLVKATMHESGRLIQSGIVELDPATAAEVRQRFSKAGDVFGGFGFRAPVWQEGPHLYTKAADDLVGCFAIVTTALQLFSPKKSRPKSSSNAKDIPFLAILTRAEEVGFIGTLAHLELGWFKKARRPLLCVSLETSRTLPGAEFGKGPVVRLGDRFTVFDSGSLRVFSELAEKILPGRHQRRIMDGGSCEATAATVYGWPSIGISVPLGNYHNQSFEGGPDSRGPLGPAPEFVHLDDVQGLLELCAALMKPQLPWDRPWDTKKKDFKKSIRQYSSLLRSKA